MSHGPYPEPLCDLTLWQHLDLDWSHDLLLLLLLLLLVVGS
jgi:hypothetical protein